MIKFDVPGDSRTKEYGVWREMLRRCFTEEYKGRFKTYEEVTCCSEWCTYSIFKNWVLSQGNISGLQLDKDILIQGNKIYSPNACCFVPHKINSLLLTKENGRGQFSLGVCFEQDSGKYGSFRNGKRIGKFKTPEEAHKAWQWAKAEQIEKAIAWYATQDCFRIDVADALTKRVWQLRLDHTLGRETKSL